MRMSMRMSMRMRDTDAGQGFLRGVGEALLVPLFFAVLGLVGVELRGALDLPASVRALYPPEMEAPSTEDRPPSLWLVDGFNVVSVGLLRERGQGEERQGWWRRENREALVERARGFDDPAAEVWIVFDGADPGGNEAGAGATPRTVFARSADDWLIDRVRAAEDPGQLRVVTADRRLANRVRARGAEVVSPGDFLGRCLV
jgi:hypothetical protein